MWSPTLISTLLSLSLLTHRTLAGPMMPDPRCNKTLSECSRTGEALTKQAAPRYPPNNSTSKLNSTTPKNIGIMLYRGFQGLDVIGPFDALWSLGRITPLNVYFLSKDKGTVRNKMPPSVTGITTNSNTTITVSTDYALGEHPPLDVLLVPGGLGTRLSDQELDLYIKFVKDIYPSLQYIISVCTGASILARAGLLDGKNATTNKAAWKWATQFGKDVKWQAGARYVTDGNIWTTSGVSAGVDGTIGWIEKVFGAETAEKVADELEWNRSAPDSDVFGKKNHLV
ncbi:hypothetical protein TWF694_005525 [Orbilia ellipsospora]|uniref:DJ-1/PfpI domain-containing protein n=1 Tax=Orbilia ellipsospora TaxID=2528407 RepID=A0AAV9WUF4_9PEZI